MPLILMTYGTAWFVLVSVEFSRVMVGLIKVRPSSSPQCCTLSEDSVKRWNFLSTSVPISVYQGQETLRNQE